MGGTGVLPSAVTAGGPAGPWSRAYRPALAADWTGPVNSPVPPPVTVFVVVSGRSWSVGSVLGWPPGPARMPRAVAHATMNANDVAPGIAPGQRDDNHAAPGGEER
ncbi:hypothetical protein GCM10011512_04580 [Tersicoccus solisilvae]|uniref:Uncharacterized protein n=1 Tax=Tersicoccus solisilvae TaxID=1882339 RepID=A0ABQ1NR80_9MICC|nr:hypothetical protein GCM10011512_04580 [Tersicoccus solisilvae]